MKANPNLVKRMFKVGGVVEDGIKRGTVASYREEYSENVSKHHIEYEGY